MAAESLKLQQAILENLKTSIDQEIDLVKSLLNDVYEALATMPEEDDVMTMQIKEVGETLNTAWQGLVTAFDQLSDKLGEVIENLKIKIAEVLEKLADMLKGGGE